MKVTSEKFYRNGEEDHAKYFSEDVDPSGAKKFFKTKNITQHYINKNKIACSMRK